MFDYTHYVPILKGKAAEFDSLAEIPEVIRDQITPLIDVPPIRLDPDTDEPTKSIDDHLQGLPVRLSRAWGFKRRLLVDLAYVGDGPMRDGRHPVKYLADEADRENPFRPVFVMGLTRADEYQQAVADAARSGEGIALRLEQDDFAGGASIQQAIDKILARLAVTAVDTDLIIDLGELQASDTVMQVAFARMLIATLPYVSTWRTLTLAGSTFPRYMAGERDSITKQSRGEWIVWDTLYANRETLPRMPTFADYGIGHPDPVEEAFDPRRMSISGQLRYTTEAVWLMVKGRSTKTAGYDQMRVLCQRLIDRPEYVGPEFSWGDRYISDCAAGIVGPGNPTVWRKIGTTHHLTFVTKQIATLTAS